MDRERFYAALDRADELVALAGSVKVKSHKRVTKSGKVTDVEQHTRSVTSMGNSDLFKEYKDLSSGNTELPETQKRSRMAQVVNEIRSRKKTGKWGPDAEKKDNEPVKTQQEKNGAPVPTPKSADGTKPFKPEADHALKPGETQDYGKRVKAEKPEAPKPEAEKPAGDNAPDDLGVTDPDKWSDQDAPKSGLGDQHEKLESPSLDRVMAAHGSAGDKQGSGEIDDPIDVGGDVQMAAKLLSEGKHIRMNKVDDVGTLLDELNRIVDEAKEKGETAPTYDLCKVSVPKTNLFCAETKGIPRAQMPQLGGQPKEGTRAWELPRNKKGEVNIEDEFRAELAARGVKIETKEVPAAFLKASQNELDGPKVAGMSRAMEKGLVPDSPIFVTKDGYIIDGHHRWASKVSIDAKDGHLGDVNMPVEMLDMEIGEALSFANGFALSMGIKPKGLGAAAEGVAPGGGGGATDAANDAAEKVAASNSVERLVALSRELYG